MQLGFTFQPALWEFTGNEDLSSIFPHIHQPQEQRKTMRKKFYLPVTPQFFAATAAGRCKKNKTEEPVIRGSYEIKTNKEHI